VDKRALLVDDELGFRQQLAAEFTHEGVSSIGTDCYQAALGVCRRERFDFAVAEIFLSRQNGFAFIRQLRQLQPGLQVFVVTSYPAISTAVAAMRAGASDFRQKPSSAREILATVNAVDPVAPVKRTLTLAEAQWEHIHRVVLDCRNNISESARRLGLRRQSLQRMMRKYAPYPSAWPTDNR
jgi:two-component system response regulator RegA